MRATIDAGCRLRLQYGPDLPPSLRKASYEDVRVPGNGGHGAVRVADQRRSGWHRARGCHRHRADHSRLHCRHQHPQVTALTGARAAAVAAACLSLASCATRGALIAPSLTPEAVRTIELTETPFYPQEKFECGPAALATALAA